MLMSSPLESPRRPSALVDLRTGAVVGTFTGDADTTYTIDPVVLVRTYPGVTGHTPGSGAVAWSSELEQTQSGKPYYAVSSAAGVVFGSSRAQGDSLLTAVDLATGEQRWRLDQEVEWCGLNNDGSLYVGANGQMVELDPATGEQISFSDAADCADVLESGYQRIGPIGLTLETSGLQAVYLGS